MLKEGDILEDRYKITDVIGKGGTSIVYRAADLRASGALRAVKAIRKNSGMDAFNAMQEAELIKEFYQKDAKNSFFPNINEIIDNDPEMLYIVQDYICLLYTSDAADDLLCVVLGGRRLIKKKKYN